MNEFLMREFCKKEEARKIIIKKFIELAAKENIKNWQENHTPDGICNRMTSKTSLENKNILVMFNLEFLETLIHKHNIERSKITFIADTETERKIAKTIYKIDKIHLIKDINELKKYTEKEIKNIKMKECIFDLCFSNPSYKRGMDLKIINSILDICEEIVVVHPSTWLLDIKNIFAPYTKFKAKISGRLKCAELFNGNPVFGVGLFVPCVITHIIKNHKGSINVNYFGNTYTELSIDDITKFGPAWKPIVEPFFIKIKNYIQTSPDGSIWSHNIKQLTPGKFYCQLAAIMGHHTKDKNILTQDDFYTLTIKDSDENKGIRQPFLDRAGNPTPTFEFNTELERDNFLYYLNTDFARFCLCLYKNNNNTSVGEMELIPWMDFTKKWDDAALYKYFGIDPATQKYIEEFLPDYYGIREAK